MLTIARKVKSIGYLENIKFMHQEFDLLHYDNVVSVGESQKIVIGSTTFKVGELIKKIKEDYFCYEREKLDKWVHEGLECEVLIPGKQWKKGKFKLAFLFYPDEAESPLDDIRQTIDRENS